MCLQEFTASNVEVVSETSHGHNVFFTPPCKGQLRLSIVVSVGALAFVSKDSYVRRRIFCCVDVCWEGKTCRVICSYLSPKSVIHACAEDLENLRAATNSREEGSAVHICVDAETGLGTMPPRLFCENVGTATVVSHRAEKRRLQEHFILANMLTTTNTFGGRRDQKNTLAVTTENMSRSRLTTSSHQSDG